MKNIYLDAWTFENKAEGWFNDNLIIPTTSREAQRKLQDLQKYTTRMVQYLDEHYEKPMGPRVGKMGKEKDKQRLLYELIQYRNNLLSGRLNENSNIIGEITSGAPDKSKQKTRIDKITLTKTGGDPNGPPVIPIGDGTRGRGGERFGGKGGEKPGINEGGDHSIITTKGNYEGK